MSGHETFAARWNRRKLATKQADVQSQLAHEQVALAPEPVPGVPPDTPLPSLDDITPSSDIAAFLQKRVPAELQKLALRKAWTSDPLISTFIEVAENQYDWNTPGGAPGFGPLDPSWDIEKLLAQATGALPDKPEPDARTAAIDEPFDHATNSDHATDGNRDKPTHTEAALTASVGTQPDLALQHPDDAPSSIRRSGGAESPIVNPLTAPQVDEHALVSHDQPPPSQPPAPHNLLALRVARHGGALPKG
jgi:hypothetical protein